MPNQSEWEQYASKRLVGRKIVAVRYLNDQEMKTLGWTNSALVVFLDDGSLIFPAKDDEGNDAGALFGQAPTKGKVKPEDWTFPVI